MGLYSENYWTLTRLFGVQQLALGYYQSSGDCGLPLSLHICERARFTMEMKLSYVLTDSLSGNPDPSAHIRFYSDAQVAEVTACYSGSRLEDVLGRGAGTEIILQHRLRMNAFFSKWLGYLESCGHSRFSLARLES